MKTNSKLLIYLLLVSFMTINCGTDDPPIQPRVPVTPPPMRASPLDPPWDYEEGVYIAGSGLTFDRFLAKVWGDENIQLSSYQQNSSLATSIFLSGHDLYVVGHQDNWTADCSFPPCNTYAMLWKNGMALPLTEVNLDSRAFSVFVANGDVYVAGDTELFTGHSIATLWINGVARQLNDGRFSASATSVFVSNDDIYVAGYEEGKAKLWKNGVPETLTGGTNAAAVFVVGTDVYVAGYGSTGAVVWRNGVPTQLSDGTIPTHATSVFVSNGDVYVVGNELHGDFNKAILWKNGEPTSLSGDQYATASSISVSGGDVYVVGQKSNMAIIWKNGIAKSLDQGIATALFIR